MSESEENQNDDGPRFPKAIIGRLLAVGLFVALGTFAVMQSMQKGEGKKPKPDATVAQNEDKSDAETPEANTKPKVDTSKTGFKAPEINKSSFDSKFTQTNPTTKAKTPPQKNKFANSFAPPSSKSFDSKPVVVSKPVTPPPRYAQAQGGAPIIGSNNGFGTRNGSITGAVGDVANKAKQTVANTAQKLKTGAKDTANGIIDATKNVTNSTTNELRNKLSGFGPTAQTPPAQKSFGPPIVRSDFGAPAKKPIAKPNVNTFGPPTQQQKVTTTVRNPIGNPTITKAPPTQITSPVRTQATQSKSPFASTTATPNPQTVTSPAKAPIVNRSFGNSGFSNNSRSSTVPPPSNSSFGQTNFPKPRTQPNNRRPMTPASTVSSPTRTPNRPVSRLASTTGPSILLARNVPGGRELDGVQAPALTVEKLSPREIQVDQPADFQIVVKNVGRVTAEDVRVFDLVPDGTEFQTASPPPASAANGKLSWEIGSLRPGQEKRIKMQLKPIRPGEIGSVAHVTFSTTASMRTLVTKPVLEILHSTKPTHLIGDDVVFDVTVKNKGDGAARNVLIQEDVPKQLEYQEGYSELEYEIGTLQPGQSRRVQLSLKAAQIGKLRNVMLAKADGGIRSKHETDLEIIAPKLVARTNGPRVRYLRRNVTHQFSIGNQGTASATNVELVARLPSGLRFVSANNQGRYDASNHSVYWSLAELARGVDADVELKTMPVEVGSQPIKFETFADLDVRANAEQPLKVEHLVDVFFDIDDVVDPIEIGSDTSYKIRIVNQGTKAATNVQMQVEFPNGLQPTAVDGSLRHNISGQRITFEPINSMNPGDEIAFVVTATGRGAGDHRVVVNMRTDGRQTPVSKEETTRVYSDR